ncbi:DUF2927 domain-containing protein [Jannaschia formosa]|uniref:DUF2927 domain-containing protein n=1 Tax=Jannaschia formosa TaxID=2259592 RepID=UPI000E1C15E3|nr:DUF2927 domain-containing protein [Jannaschia formosa]TFL19596.1 DUF2927 domain-containing protein [Jannaschia formosa]
MRAGLALPLAALCACANTAAVPPPEPFPAPAPVRAAEPPTQRPAVPAGPSEESLSARQYYRRLEARGLTEGLMRRDGGGIDTRFTAEDLARNFEEIAFRSELSFRGGALTTASSDRDGVLRRWTGSVRIELHFGDSVGPQMRREERLRLEAYAARLRRVTGHPISVVGNRGNFHVFLVDVDEQRALAPRLQELLPTGELKNATSIATLGRQVYCSIVAWPARDGSFSNGLAVTFVRAELPDLSRLACYHEEIAQGLGLGNDSPLARPSIFNDDDEFALLTTHDEYLLRILYDPRLRPGMTAREARPIVRQIARELVPPEPI